MFKEFVEEYVVPMMVAIGVLMAVVALAWLTGDTTPAARGSEVYTTINRAELMEAETTSGDSELPLVKFAATVDRATGWSDLPMKKQAKIVMVAGITLSTIGKAVPTTVDGGFTHSFLRQLGAQMQVQAMYQLDMLSPNPVIAAGQGFLIGL